MARYQVMIGDREFEVELQYHSGKYEVSINGQLLHVESHSMGGSRSLLLVDNQALEVDVRTNGLGGEKSIFLRGLEIPVSVEEYNLAMLRKRAGLGLGPAMEKLLKAPMPGLIVDLRVKPGQKVKKGDPLVVIEAMKMENIIKAKGEAVVKSVHVEAGVSIEKGNLLLEFE